MTRRGGVSRRCTLALLALVLVASCSDAPGPAPESWRLASPSGRLVIEVARANLGADGAYPDATRLYYRVLRDGAGVLAWSPLGLRTVSEDFVDDLAWEAERQRDIDDAYRMAVGKRRDRAHRAHELTLRFSNPAGAEIEIDFRASNDGAAFRYRLLGSGEATAVVEESGFHLPAGTDAWMQPYDRATPFGPAYEEFVRKVAAGETNAQNGWSDAALFRVPDAAYVLLAEAGLDAGYAATHLAQPEGTLYRIAYPAPDEGNGVGEATPRAPLPWTTPWRVAIVGELADVVASTLVDDLSAPPPDGVSVDAPWLRPGRSAWSWWSQNTGDPALQREYVDFAAELGWEYVLVDANWNEWPSPDDDVRALAAYAAERGVGIFLWYNSGGAHNVVTEQPRDRMDDPGVRRAEMARIAGLGVRGIKVDFFQSDKQDRIQQYLGILADAFTHQLLVNFHGSTLPRGWQRTFPNLVTIEAVHGAESYRLRYGPSAIDNVRLVFTRNVVGSMDYTPLTFAAALEQKGISYAHQLALSVAFESGVQHFADRADADPTMGFRRLFAQAPFARDFLATVPTTWDETRLVDGDPDTHAVLARRSGDDWLLAGISGADGELELTLDLGFLEQDAYELHLIATGAAPDQLVESSRTLLRDEPLRVRIGPRDGFVARLRAAAPADRLRSRPSVHSGLVD